MKLASVRNYCTTAICVRDYFLFQFYRVTAGRTATRAAAARTREFTRANCAALSSHAPSTARSRRRQSSSISPNARAAADAASAHARCVEWRTASYAAARRRAVATSRSRSARRARSAPSSPRAESSWASAAAAIASEHRASSREQADAARSWTS